MEFMNGSVYGHMLLLSEERIHYSSGSQPADWDPLKDHKIYFKGYKMGKYVFILASIQMKQPNKPAAGGRKRVTRQKGWEPLH